MVLIGESGSTKTDWRLINNGEVHSFKTIGFNPYFINGEAILSELAKSSLSTIKNDVEQVFFYGAGCSQEKKCKEVLLPLTEFFNKATKIEVDHDLLAAARALCGNNQGMAGILGTGSNSCIYDGIDIIDSRMAFGYLFGDYGSGAHLGKTFIASYLRKELPEGVVEAFNKEYRIEPSDILDKIYKSPLPNKFLASFSPFIFKWTKDPEVRKLVENSFKLFFEKDICKYSGYRGKELHLVGSVAYFYKDIISTIALDYDVIIGKIIKQPIEELVKFHGQKT